MRRLFLFAALCAALLLAAPVASGQTISNPLQVMFTCSADHSVLSSYVIGYFTAGATEPMQTADLGKPTPDAQNECAATINSRPLVFGLNYVAKVRSMAGTVAGEWSDPSNPFDRRPGRTGTPALK